MSIPLPKQELNGHCSAIHDNTLYVLSSTGVQSLRLKENATWSEEKAGVSVTGSACVTAVPGDDASQAALYVIGGTAEDSSYNGLQRYFFSNRTWETLSPMANNLQDRTDHSAAYLSDSRSIVVYAGSQPDAPSYLSSQTFLIQTESPYNIESFISRAPPANQPILQPWNSSHAVLAGGSTLDNSVYTFEPSAGWQALGTNLSQPLAPGIRGTIVDGSDGSRVLETYDMTSSPNKVSQIVLLDAGGRTAATGQTVGSSSTRKRKRDLTLDNWPSYNSTNAPTASRSDYSLAQSTDGLAVLAGGNAKAPVSLFDQTGNSWVDASKFFNGDDQQPLQPSSTSASATATPTTSSEPSTTTTAAAAPTGGLSPHDQMLRTLGITLGVLCGIAALFILALLFVRHRRTKKDKKSGYTDEDDEKQGNRMSFADRGASFMKEAGGSVLGLAPPSQNRYNDSQAGSHTSLAIIAGKFGNKRNTPSHATKGSMESTANLVRDKNGTTIGGEPVEMLDVGDKKYLAVAPVHKKPGTQNLPPPRINVLGSSPEDEIVLRDRSSGWSRYFSTSQPNDLTHIPSAYVIGRKSDGSEWQDSGHSSGVSRIPSSALVAPLDIDFSKTVDGQRLSNVVFASPAFSDSREDLARRGSTVDGQEGHIESADRPLSSSNTASSYDRSTMSSDYYNGISSANTPWTPVSNSYNNVAIQDRSRPTSSLYTNSVHEQRVPSRGARTQNSGFFPGSGTTAFNKPQKLRLGHAASPTSDWASATGAAKDTPLLKQPPPVAALAAVHDRDSTATVFPHENGNRWTANVPKDTPAGALQPPRAPGFANGDRAADTRDSTVTVFPRDNGDAWTAKSSNDLRPPQAPGMAANDNGRPAEDRDSTVTVFPRGVPSAYYANRPKEIDEHETRKHPMSSDMSWVNLGLSQKP
jgi:hypothetical protein